MSDMYLYLDTETTHLDDNIGSVWEIAYAIGDEPVKSAVVSHTLVGASDVSLEVGEYWRRMHDEPFSAHEGIIWEGEMRRRLETFEGTLYLVGANPAFDQRFLSKRWGTGTNSLWHYRAIDLASFAMGALGPLASIGTWTPKGLFTIATVLRDLGHDVPLPDHSAAGDVESLRACFKTLMKIYGGENE